jgi:hypothetical protein
MHHNNIQTFFLFCLPVDLVFLSLFDSVSIILTASTASLQVDNCLELAPSLVLHLLDV